MVEDQGAMITYAFDQSIEAVIGKITIAPTEKAKMLWDIFRKQPDAFEFAVGYIEHKDGTKELVEISMVPKGKK